MKAYKLTDLQGRSFYDHTTKWAVGKTVKIAKKRRRHNLCAPGVLHACPNPNDSFVGASIPCRAFVVEGEPVTGDGKKFGFHELRVLEEVSHLDRLFGWNYSEAIKPVHPFHIKPPKKITQRHIRLLKEWASVRDSVGASVRDSVWDRVWASVGASVWDRVWDSVWASVWDSVWDSVGPSVWDSVGAYFGSLFPGIKNWKWANGTTNDYPFRAAVDLWHMGLIPSLAGKTWRLHGGPDGNVLWQGTLEEAQA